MLEVISRLAEVFNICLLVNGIRLAGFTFFFQAKNEDDRRRIVASVLWLPVILLEGA